MHFLLKTTKITVISDDLITLFTGPVKPPAVFTSDTDELEFDYLLVKDVLHFLGVLN